MQRIRFTKLSVVAAGLLFAAGCRTDKDVMDDYERRLIAGEYTSLAAEPRQLADDGGSSRLLWRLLSAGGGYLACDGSAVGEFDRAEDIFSEHERRSPLAAAGGTSLSIVTNDRSLPYTGCGQDRIFTCFYKAVEYASVGNRDAARTELNRAELHQDNWLYARKRDIAETREKMERDASAYEREQAKEGKAVEGGVNCSAAVENALADASFAAAIREKCGYDPATSGNLELLTAKDYLNTYVEHATGVFRWLNGDDGRNCLRDAAGLAAENPVVRRDFAEIEAGGVPSGQVWVYVEDGLCPVREEWRLDLPLVLIPYANRYVMYAGMALPYLRDRDFAAGAWRVNGVAMSELLDVNRLLHVEYDVYMRGALAREIARTILKVGTQVALGIVSENSDDWRVQYAAKASQAAVAGWALATTAADMRCWTALPKRVLVMRVDRPADGRISVQADGVVFTFDVPSGNSMAIVRKPSAASAAVVKVIGFN